MFYLSEDAFPGMNMDEALGTHTFFFVEYQIFSHPEASGKAHISPATVTGINLLISDITMM